ncbi:MAG: adenylate/guanylate cyclase domain-containing protein [Betaproteobacteria bacterium]|nr:adenylate/guanylate cyclase domain-containing protein [Betaproteobacteria bacterium]
MQGDGRPGTGGEPFERRLATILMADIVGYSRMMEANEERTLRVFRGHREIFDAMLVQHRGRMFNTAGDAVLAEFPSAVDAVRCATEIQSALRTRNDHLSPDERMQFRIGVNLGDVIVQGTDLLGDGVNVAARIQTAAEPGGVCVSGSVYDQIRNKLSLEFHSMGERTFKNITQPVRVFSIGDEADQGARPAPRLPPRRRRTRRALGPGRRDRGGRRRLAIAAGAGWWYVQDRETKVAEAARASEARRAAEQVAAAEAARWKAEEDATARVAAEREARLKAELEAAQRGRRRRSARPPRGGAGLVVQGRGEDAPHPAPPRRRAAGRAAGRRGSRRRPAVQAGGAFANDGRYRGRACWQMPESGKAPYCWPLEFAIDQHKIASSWVGSYGGGKSSTIRGQLTPQGSVNALFEGFGTRGNPINADIGGQVADGRLTLAGTLPNGVRITSSATRVR